LDRRTLWLVTVLALALAIAGPILLALHVARQQAFAAETQRALSYARDVLARAETTADQIDAAFRALAADPAAAPCSSAELGRMRHLDLASNRIQALGRVSGEVLACYSLQRDAETFPLGPVDAVQPGGERLRFDVQLPGVPDARFLVVERDGLAALVHRDFPIDAAAEARDVSLAVLVGGEHRILTSRGEIRPQWIEALRGQPEATLVDADRVVAVVASSRHAFGAAASLATVEPGRRVAAMAMLVAPAGILAGLVMVLAVYHESKRQLALPAVIRSALRRNEFFLAYQPVVDLATGQWVGAEALIRWQRSSGELVQPHEFLAAAEDAGLIQCITRRVFELVAKDAAGLFQQYPGFQLALNLSAADLHDDATVAQLRLLAERLHAHPGNLLIEASERGFANPRLAGLIVEKLYGAGMRVAIDDFGTGHSSLQQLQRIKLDYLKIDKSFVDTVGTDAATSEVVANIVRMARALKLEMIAEGVESEEQATFLREHGVRYAQGWLFARPLSLEELRERLARQAGTTPG
jgi:sensor c-di-GMP phosphodiesterase-like protein